MHPDPQPSPVVDTAVGVLPGPSEGASRSSRPVRRGARYWTHPAVGLLVAALAIRVAALPHESPDYRYYLGPWFAHLQSQGLAGFAEPFANYNPPYLYLLYLGSVLGLPALVAVKAISLLGDAALATAVLAALGALGRTREAATAGAVMVLFVPTVVLNSAFWGQCDGLYTALLIWVAVLVIRRAQNRAWLVFGAAFALKLQAVFILPFIGAAWLFELAAARGDGGTARTRTRWWSPAVATIPLLLALLPAWLSGRPLPSLLGIYSSQAGSIEFLSFAPNVWSWFPSGEHPALARLALVLTATACGGLALLAYARRGTLHDPVVVWRLATLLLLVVPFLLPHMRERYFFAGEVFLFVAAWATGRLVWAATGMLGLSMLANLASLALIAPINQASLSVVVLAVLVAVALPLLTRSGGRPHLRDEPPAEWPAVPR